MNRWVGVVILAVLMLVGAGPASAQHQKNGKSSHSSHGGTRGGRGGGHYAHRNNRRIDGRTFGERFGRAHYFNIGEPVFFGGFPGFAFGGFNFCFIEPWPVGWAYTDAVYVDYVDYVDDGYYLYNPTYPGVRIGVSIQ